MAATGNIWITNIRRAEMMIWCTSICKPQTQKHCAISLATGKWVSFAIEALCA